MSTDPRRRNSRWIALSTLLVLASGLVASPVLATGCNTAGCYSATVEFLRIRTDGKIWFGVNNSDELNKLIPEDCVVKAQFYAGSAQPALYIAAEDPLRDQKYAMLLSAFHSTTGVIVGFLPERDPATGWCAVGQLDMQ